MPPIVDFSARSILGLRLVIAASNTGPLPAASAAPRRAEQKAQSHRKRERGERMLFDRLLRGFAEVLARVAQGLADALAHVPHGLVDPVLHAVHALLDPGNCLAPAGTPD